MVRTHGRQSPRGAFFVESTIFGKSEAFECVQVFNGISFFKITVKPSGMIWVVKSK